jgi:hypothetical protein
MRIIQFHCLVPMRHCDHCWRKVGADDNGTQSNMLLWSRASSRYPEQEVKNVKTVIYLNKPQGVKNKKNQMGNDYKVEGGWKKEEIVKDSDVDMAQNKT